MADAGGLMKYAKLNEMVCDQEKTLDALSQYLQSLMMKVNRIERLDLKVQNIDIENQYTNKEMMALIRGLDKKKADKEQIETTFFERVDYIEKELKKGGRKEIYRNIADINSRVTEMGDIVTENHSEFRTYASEVNQILKHKIGDDDFEALQKPMHHRLTAFAFAIKKLNAIKKAIAEVPALDAAAYSKPACNIQPKTAKCLCCGQKVNNESQDRKKSKKPEPPQKSTSSSESSTTDNFYKRPRDDDDDDDSPPDAPVPLQGYQSPYGEPDITESDEQSPADTSDNNSKVTNNVGSAEVKKHIYAVEREIYEADLDFQQSMGSDIESISSEERNKLEDELTSWNAEAVEENAKAADENAKAADENAKIDQPVFDEAQGEATDEKKVDVIELDVPEAEVTVFPIFSIELSVVEHGSMRAVAGSANSLVRSQSDVSPLSVRIDIEPRRTSSDEYPRASSNVESATPEYDTSLGTIQNSQTRVLMEPEEKAVSTRTGKELWAIVRDVFIQGNLFEKKLRSAKKIARAKRRNTKDSTFVRGNWIIEPERRELDRAHVLRKKEKKKKDEERMAERRARDKKAKAAREKSWNVETPGPRSCGGLHTLKDMRRNIRMQTMELPPRTTRPEFSCGEGNIVYHSAIPNRLHPMDYRCPQGVKFDLDHIMDAPKEVDFTKVNWNEVSDVSEIKEALAPWSKKYVAERPMGGKSTLLQHGQRFCKWTPPSLPKDTEKREFVNIEGADGSYYRAADSTIEPNPPFNAAKFSGRNMNLLSPDEARAFVATNRSDARSRHTIRRIVKNFGNIFSAKDEFSHL